VTVVILAGDGDSTWIVHNALRERFPVSALLVEPDPPARELLRRRARRIGRLAVAGQVAFILYARLTRRFSTARRDEILREHGLSRTPAPGAVTRVPSANSREAIDLLQSLRPDVVVVNGTRILSQEVLDCVDAPFLNMHAGITPMYRGVHGCYWALAGGDAAHAGVTVHLVDAGVDTGGVVAQALVQPGPADSYHTYPFLQVAAGLPLLEQAVADALAGQLRTADVTGESRLYYQPTIWRYALTRVRRGVR
jgi:phosphoribosylglycinamide formyltransferase-1